MNTSTKTLLSVALLTVLASSGVVFAQSQGTSPVNPQAIVSAPSPVSAPVPAPQAVVLPPSPSPGAPAPTPASSQAITATAAAQSQPLPPNSDVERLRADSEAQALRIAEMTAAGADESVLLREISRYRAKLSLLNVASQVEKAQQTMASDRLKFQVEQAKSQAELQSTRAPAAGAVNGAPMLPGSQMPLPAVEEKVDVSLVGVSSFAGKRIAEVSSPEFGRVMVEVGASLPNGARVTSITDSAMVITYRGKRQNVYFSAPDVSAEKKQPASAVNKR